MTGSRDIQNGWTLTGQTSNMLLPTTILLQPVPLLTASSQPTVSMVSAATCIRILLLATLPLPPRTCNYNNLQATAFGTSGQLDMRTSIP